MSNAVVVKEADRSIINSNVQKFCSLMQKGMSAIQEACVTYVNTIQLYPESKEEFVSFNPLISASTWHAMELIGLGKLCVEFMTMPSKYLQLIQAMPPSEQIKLTEKIQVLSYDGTPKMCDFEELTETQKYQVLSPHRVRTIAQQRTYIEDYKLKKLHFVDITTKSTSPTKPYRIFNEGSKWKLSVNKPTIFTKETLLRILTEMRPKDNRKTVEVSSAQLIKKK